MQVGAYNARIAARRANARPDCAKQNSRSDRVTPQRVGHAAFGMAGKAQTRMASLKRTLGRARLLGTFKRTGEGARAQERQPIRRVLLPLN